MDKLLSEALKARENAYVPYSKFKVGAAVMSKNGNIYGGCNIENASYGLTSCAERNAIFHAISSGEKELVAICVVADTKGPVSPCGACRQVISEFKINKILLANCDGKTKEMTLEELLPYSFTNEDIEESL